MTDMLAIKWADADPAEGTTDLIPRYWFRHDGISEFRQHIVIGKDSAWQAKVRCSITVQGNIVDIDYAGDHADSNIAHGFMVGCTRLRFADETRQGMPAVLWKYPDDVDFSGEWKYVPRDHRTSPAQDTEPFDPKDKTDARKKIERLVAVRQGQSRFRDDLLQAYGGRCAITGCTIEEILQAAHIMPARDGQTNHVQNGLLLRADIHTRFDLDILRIDGDYRIWVPDGVRTNLGIPHEITNHPKREEDRPSREALNERWADAAARCKSPETIESL
ncbi:hypothetical protein V474_24080 [Novosphingobium barchaimii LL02]|uniref:HNH nuclease domain-containing protein n=1 Tax=Novosphingobium barchaimii LL02 TaxID=1114963 RepID=A0A0J8ACU8_9SPHN|nr:HNH endonuclease [Novosphingobium barchaimii]KMS52935.1 hypothetical protein V474_24080 [Novosphingobium barchaimii LL02]